ncbi:hypothetical protein Tco_1226142 [Tanacetum coccineum]
MADNRTMAQMLQAPIEGYEDAIVVPPINANNFELKQPLINLVQSNKFTGRQDPHNHLRFFNKVTSTFRHPEVPNTSVKLLLFPFSLDGEARDWLDKEPPRSILTWDDLVNQTLHAMRNIKMTMPRMQLNSKFVNNMLPEWGRFVTAVKLNRRLRDSNYDQLYAYLKQHEAHANKNKMMLECFTQLNVDPIGLDSNVSHHRAVVMGGVRTELGKATLQVIAMADKCFKLQRVDIDDWECIVNLMLMRLTTTAHTMFMANLLSVDPVYDEASPPYDSDILFEKKVAIGYKNPLCLTSAKQVQPALYNGHENIKTNHVSAIVHSSKDTLEIAETTRKLMNEKNDRPRDLIKMKAEALKEQTTTSRPIKALTVYPLNTPATLVPRRITPTGLTEGERGFEQTKECYLTEVIPFFKTLKDHFEGIQKALTKEIKEMKDIFKELEAEVDQNVVNRKHDEIKRKNLLIANDNLIVDCLSKEVFYIATNSELTVSRFTEMHDAHTVVQARCLELEAELSKLHDKVQKDNHTELVKHFSNLEVNHLNLLLKYQNLKESFRNNTSPPARDAPDFDSVFVIEKMKAFIQGKDNAIKKLRMQISQLKETRSEADRTLDFRALDFQITKLTEKITVLQEQNELFRAENAKIKQHYKELYDSIKITRAKHIKQTTPYTEIGLKSQIHEKYEVHHMDSVKPRVLAPGRYDIDVKPILPHNRNNREVHLDYLKHLKESVETLREIVKEAKVERPLDRSLTSACLYTKHSQELLEYVIGTCPKDFNKRDKKHASTPSTRNKQVTLSRYQLNTSNNNATNPVEQLIIPKTNVTVIPSTGINSCTDASGSQPRSNTKKNRISSAKSVNKKKVEERPRTNKSLENHESKHSCYVQDTDGVELIKGSRGSNLYNISVEDMMKSSPICLLSKASKNKSLLWHRRLNYLNLEVVATVCYTQNRSLIHTRHNKTPYELVHDKKPDLTFFRVFGALCYPTNDSEDLGKLQPTSDIGLVPNPIPAAPYVPPTNKDMEILFQPLFNEYLEPPRVERSVSPALAVQVLVNSTGTPSFTTIDKDAHSPSHSPSSSALKSLSSHQGVAAESPLMEDNLLLLLTMITS